MAVVKRFGASPEPVQAAPTAQQEEYVARQRSDATLETAQTGYGLPVGARVPYTQEDIRAVAESGLLPNYTSADNLRAVLGDSVAGLSDAQVRAHFAYLQDQARLTPEQQQQLTEFKAASIATDPTYGRGSLSGTPDPVSFTPTRMFQKPEDAREEVNRLIDAGDPFAAKELAERTNVGEVTLPQEPQQYDPGWYKQETDGVTSYFRGEEPSVSYSEAAYQRQPGNLWYELPDDQKTGYSPAAYEREKKKQAQIEYNPLQTPYEVSPGLTVFPGLEAPIGIEPPTKKQRPTAEVETTLEYTKRAREHPLLAKLSSASIYYDLGIAESKQFYKSGAKSTTDKITDLISSKMEPGTPTPSYMTTTHKFDSTYKYNLNTDNTIESPPSYTPTPQWYKDVIKTSDYIGKQTIGFTTGLVVGALDILNPYEWAAAPGRISTAILAPSYTYTKLKESVKTNPGLAAGRIIGGYYTGKGVIKEIMRPRVHYTQQAEISYTFQGADGKPLTLVTTSGEAYKDSFFMHNTVYDIKSSGVAIQTAKVKDITYSKFYTNIEITKTSGIFGKSPKIKELGGSLESTIPTTVPDTFKYSAMYGTPKDVSFVVDPTKGLRDISFTYTPTYSTVGKGALLGIVDTDKFKLSTTVSGSITGSPGSVSYGRSFGLNYVLKPTTKDFMYGSGKGITTSAKTGGGGFSTFASAQTEATTIKTILEPTLRTGGRISVGVASLPKEKQKSTTDQILGTTTSQKRKTLQFQSYTKTTAFAPQLGTRTGTLNDLFTGTTQTISSKSTQDLIQQVKQTQKPSTQQGSNIFASQQLSPGKGLFPFGLETRKKKKKRRKRFYYPEYSKKFWEIGSPVGLNKLIGKTTRKKKSKKLKVRL